MSGFENDVMVAKNLNFDDAALPPHLGIITAAGMLAIGTGDLSPTPEILGGSLTSPDNSITFGYSSPDITAVVNTSVVTDLHTARYIVSGGGLADGANYTTIQSAINDAQGAGGNQTIFIQPGTYTENFTLPIGINLAAYDCDATTPNVTIVGTITVSGAGTVSISGIQLQTNSAPLLTVSGSVASVVILSNCFFNITNNTGISFTSSSASAQIVIRLSRGNITSTGIALFTSTSPGQLAFNYTNFGNSGGSTTASTTSSGSIDLFQCGFQSPFSSSSTGAYTISYTNLNTSNINATCLTTAGTGSSVIEYSDFVAGTASTLSIGAGTTVRVQGQCRFDSSNANAITGAGTIIYSLLTYTGSSSTNNVTTQTLYPSQPAIGTFIKQVRASTTTAGSTATALPFDATIPQITEGAEILTVAITPTNTNNILVIEAQGWFATAGGNGGGLALFQDATANALAASVTQVGINTTLGTIRFYMTAGTTSATTFRLRGGYASGATFYWLQTNLGTNVYSTASIVTLTVSEYSA